MYSNNLLIKYQKQKIMQKEINVGEVELNYKKDKKAEKFKISSSEKFHEYLGRIFDPNKIDHKEFFYAIYTDRSNHVLGHLKISEGGVAGTYVDPKMIFQGALLRNASSVLVSHNHPSGNLRPSQADKDLTERLVSVGEFMDLKVLDHIIYTGDSYLSFADERLILKKQKWKNYQLKVLSRKCQKTIRFKFHQWLRILV